MIEKSTAKKILILEDDYSCLHNMETALKVFTKNHDNYEIINPGPVEMIGQALRLIRDHSPDIILLDMNFGRSIKRGVDSDGYRVAERLQESERAKIICTSGEPENYREVLKPLGIRHFGGKFNFTPCISGECDCNKTAG